MYFHNIFKELLRNVAQRIQKSTVIFPVYRSPKTDIHKSLRFQLFTLKPPLLHGPVYKFRKRQNVIRDHFRIEYLFFPLFIVLSLRGQALLTSVRLALFQLAHSVFHCFGELLKAHRL